MARYEVFHQVPIHLCLTLMGSQMDKYLAKDRIRVSLTLHLLVF